MGHGLYDTHTRSARASSLGYATKSVDAIFTQQSKGTIHESMTPRNINLRECRDSANHPAVLPVLLFLDVTGSMSIKPLDLFRSAEVDRIYPDLTADEYILNELKLSII